MTFILNKSKKHKSISSRMEAVKFSHYGFHSTKIDVHIENPY
jgi:hypothetical protein